MRPGLCELLASKPVTQFDSEIMRYLIKLYRSGEPIDKYDGIKISASVYEPTEFVEGSYLGGFDVHDESLFITDLETLKKAFGAYSQSQKLIQNAQGFLDMQDKYKVNALFAASVSIIETSAGRAGNAINGCNNWFNITGTGGPYKTTTNKHGETYNWRIYSSAHEGIGAFGNLIANGSYYYKQGNYTVGTIGAIYCPNTDVHPTQADDWTANVTAQIIQFYSEVGIDISVQVTDGGAGGIAATGGQGYRGMYTTASGKNYIEYLQYAGPWTGNSFCGGTMQSSGCSITSAAVILSGYGIDVNPEDLRSKYPNSTSISGLIQSYGLNCTVKNAGSYTKEELRQHLSSGNPVIVNAGGYWTNSSGHYFPVLEGNGDQGYVSNVGSSTKTGWYDIDKIMESNKKILFISQ